MALALAGQKLVGDLVFKALKAVMALGPKQMKKNNGVSGFHKLVWKHSMLNFKALGAECGNRKARNKFKAMMAAKKMLSNP